MNKIEETIKDARLVYAKNVAHDVEENTLRIVDEFWNEAVKSISIEYRDEGDGLSFFDITTIDISGDNLEFKECYLNLNKSSAIQIRDFLNRFLDK